MTVCYAYATTWPPAHNWDLDYPCHHCQHYFWEHSHEEMHHGDRMRHAIISKAQAMVTYDRYHHKVEPGADVRDRYQMMMDRQPGACAWFKLQAAKEVQRYAVLREFLEAGATIAAGETVVLKADGKVWPFPPGTPIKQNFGTYVPTTYNPYYGPRP